MVAYRAGERKPDRSLAVAKIGREETANGRLRVIWLVMIFAGYGESSTNASIEHASEPWDGMW